MLEGKNKQLRAIYLHGRPAAHPIHQALAKAVTSEFRFVDEPLRWQDKNRPQALNIVACMINALLFRGKKNYDVFLVDNLHFTPVFLKIFGLIDRKQKIVVHLGSHTLYFMSAGKFSRFTSKLHRWALNKYDAVICEGNYSFNIAKALLNKPYPMIYESFIGITEERKLKLNECVVDTGSGNILIIAGGPTEFRKFYKGLDLMLDGFRIAIKNLPDLKLNIIGHWSIEIINKLLENYSADEKAKVKFLGPQAQIENHFSSTALCLHCTRGDAFPTSTIETMCAGIPTMVSETTGTKQIVREVDEKLIVAPEQHAIAAGITWYFNESAETRKILSERAKKSTYVYSEMNSIEHYQKIFKNIVKDLKN